MIKIEYPEDTRNFYVTYAGQCQPQRVYLELDPEAEPPTLRMDYDGETGDAEPMAVWHRRLLRYYLPAVPTTDAARELLIEVESLAVRVTAGYFLAWSGDDYVGHLDGDACKAEDEIDAVIRAMSSDDWLPVMDASEYFSEDPPADVHPDTTDSELETMAEIWRKVAWTDTPPLHLVGVVAALRDVREHRRDVEEGD